MNMACLVTYFYKLELMVKIGKIGLKFKTPFFQGNIPEKWLII
jgi:hypothetical protein